MSNTDTTCSGGVFIAHRGLVVSVLLIVFWWCLYCSSCSGGVCITHLVLVVSVLLTTPFNFVYMLPVPH
jgi:hypothetical protein